MKKLFTMLTVVAISTTISFAQQGTVAIGVGSNLADVSWQDYSLTPTVGYFITDNMMVGTGFSMGSSSESGIDPYASTLTNVEGKTSGFDMSPFLRFYFGEALYASAGISIGSTSSTTTYTDATNSSLNTVVEGGTSSFGLNIGVGYSLMWNDRIAIEPSFGIATGSGSSSGSTTISTSTSTVTTSNDNDAPSTFGMAIGLGINIRLGME
jgi:hypothetical protein